MRVLVVGATGLLGRAVAQRFRLEGCDVLGTGLSRAGDAGVVTLDARDAAAVRALVRRERPDAVINASGERRPERWTDTVLHEVNVQAPENIAAACAESGSWLVHVSSDYVFDGTTPPYHPHADRRPLNPYGRAKLRAEDRVRAVAPHAAVLRVPVLYGPVERIDESNMTALLPLVLDAEEKAVDDWAVRHPTHTADASAVLHDMVRRRADLQGVTCHWSAREGLTKYEMALRIGAVLKRPTDHLRPDASPAADRPRDTRLDTSLLSSMGIKADTSLDEALPAVLAPWTAV